MNLIENFHKQITETVNRILVDQFRVPSDGIIIVNVAVEVTATAAREGDIRGACNVECELTVEGQTFGAEVVCSPDDCSAMLVVYGAQVEEDQIFTSHNGLYGYLNDPARKK